MTTEQTVHPLVAETPSSNDIDDRRRAGWLLTPYSAPIWKVTDTNDQGRTVTINFEHRLADGRLLTEAARLYATVKEYAWLVRDPRFSRIDDATAHVILVRNLMHVAHALTLLGIESFAHLVPYDVEQLVEKCRFGADAVLRASERVESHLKGLAEKGRQLPLYTIPSTGKTWSAVAAEQIIIDCNLPDRTSGLPRVAQLIGVAARDRGLTTKATPKPEMPAFMNLTSQALQRWLDPIESLWVMRRHMEAEAITFKPFAQGAAKVAVAKGVPAARTPIPPPRLALYLFEQSARWVFERSDALSTRLSQARANQNDSGLDRDITLMATACWILIAAFSARRDSEVDELEADCLAGSDADGWWLFTYIEKTLQRKDWIPVPSIVARAVATLLKISAPARALMGNRQIFQYVAPVSGKAVALDVGRHLDDFAAAVGVPMHEPRGAAPKAWHWTPHQFRRFFAILFFHRYEGASIETLSHHLRHFNLEMTRRYVTQDKEVASLWLDIEWGFMGHVARSIVAGERAVGGAMGDCIKEVARRIIDQFRRKLQIVTPDRAGASVAMFMQRKGLVLTPKPWVTCACPWTADAVRTASCRQGQVVSAEAVGPDFAQAGPIICAACPFAILEVRSKSFAEGDLTDPNRNAVDGSRAGTLFEELEKAQLVKLSYVLNDRFTAITPLTPGLTATEEGE